MGQGIGPTGSAGADHPLTSGQRHGGKRRLGPMLLARNRNFRLLFSASAVSNLGDGISALAFPWLATLITRDPFWIGFVAAAGRMPWLLFALPAGVVIDRVDRRRLLVQMDIARMVMTMAVVAMIFGAPDMPLADGSTAAIPLLAGLSVAAFLLGVAEVFRDNAAQTAMPSVVDQKDLERANGQLWSVEQIMGQFIGPPLAGFLIAMAVPIPFLFDAATFGIAAMCVWMIAMQPSPRAKPASFASQFREGASWMLGNKVVFTFAILLSILNFVTFGCLAILVLLSQDIYGLDAAGHGLLLSVSALGAVAGGLLGPAVAERLKGRNTILLALAVMAPTFAALALTSSPVVASLALAAMWFGGMTWNVVTVSLRQRIIPAEILGRVNAIYRFFGWGSIPLGALAAGALVSAFEPSLGRDMALRIPFAFGSCVVLGLLVWAALRLRLPDAAT